MNMLFLDVQILCSRIASASEDNDNDGDSLILFTHQWNCSTKLAKFYLR